MSWLSLPRLRPRLALPAVLAALCAAAMLAACGGDSEDPTGSMLAERWLRLGEDVGTGVVVYESALPPMLSDLLNPSATVDTPEEDLLRLPVHPAGELLGSYLLRRPDGSHLVWLFYDVPPSERDRESDAQADAGGDSPGGGMGVVTSDVARQLDESPWQVVGEQGNRAYTVVQFQSTRGDDLSGTAIVEPVAGTETFAVRVDRDGTGVTLEVARAAASPLIEAEFADDLTVERVLPGLAREAGLREGDRVVGVGDTAVASREEMARALTSLGDGPGPVSVTYLLQVAGRRAAPPSTYIPRESLALPAEFPLRGALEHLLVDQYETFLDPRGGVFRAFLLTAESTSAVAGQMRDALTADNWEIVADEPVGFATSLLFANADETLQGSMQIDLFPGDESFTQVVVQIQTAPPGG
ncbi:MAG: hypothetical protein M0R73_06150 [Dehalococcoidia bacterium]|nr:hypothetical protein [Dehalococcoidia bacterium]